LRGKKDAYSTVVALDQEAKGAATTSINAFEIYFGAYKSKMQSENLKETERLLDRLQVIPMDQSSSKKAAEISAKLNAIGEPIDYRDAMIAAIALQNDLTLLTRDKAHFSRIKGLTLETW
jgi:tRNA(fMet)-specific endonuclease VapC